MSALPSLCAPRAVVIWTRHREAPDLTPKIRDWFGTAGFAEEAFGSPEGTLMSVGVHRLIAQPATFQPGRQLFRFV